MRRAVSATLLGLLAVGLTACTGVPEERLPDTGGVLEGTVKYAGEEVQFAQIAVSDGKGQATGTIGEDGRYKVLNVPLGPVKVAVNTKAAMGDYQSAVMAAGYKGADTKKIRKGAVKFVDVPAKYYDPATSGLTTTISKGSNTFDIAIPK